MIMIMLVELILERYSKANMKYLVTGLIFDRLAYKINTELTEHTGIQLKCPLWGLTHEEILTNIEKRNIKAIIANIDPNLLNTDWLGKIYDRNVYNKLVKLNINPFGDDGEFDTTLTDADYFKKKLSYKILGINDNYGLELKLNVEE